MTNGEIEKFVSDRFYTNEIEDMVECYVKADYICDFFDHEDRDAEPSNAAMELKDVIVKSIVRTIITKWESQKEAVND